MFNRFFKQKQISSNQKGIQEDVNSHLKFSKKFKNDIPYVSDSNGYWRFRSLRDVLSNANDERLHVLTHPGWWQEKPLEPFERIERCVEGRSSSVFLNYNKQMKKDGRKTIGKKN